MAETLGGCGHPVACWTRATIYDDVVCSFCAALAERDAVIKKLRASSDPAEEQKRRAHRDTLSDDEWFDAYIRESKDLGYTFGDEMCARIASLREAREKAEARLREWIENVEYMLKMPESPTVRSCEGGGPEDLVKSLVITFNKALAQRDDAEARARVIEAHLNSQTDISASALKTEAAAREEARRMRDGILAAMQSGLRAPVYAVLQAAITPSAQEPKP